MALRRDKIKHVAKIYALKQQNEQFSCIGNKCKKIKKAIDKNNEIWYSNSCIANQKQRR